MPTLRTEYVDIPTAAEHIGVSAITLRRWIYEKRLPAYRFGPRSVRVRVSELESLFAPIH